MNISDFNSLNLNNNQKLFNIFKNSFLKSNLSHSTMICGEKGIGKSTFVKYLVDKIFNNFLDYKDGFNLPKHTRLILNNTHPNFIVISKLIDEKSKKLLNNITVDQIRNLESFIYQSSLLELPKVILIDSADDLNISASNALLKILEEPKNNTFFFLISHHPSLLLPTIRSRCIKFKFLKPTFNEFKKILLLNSDDLINDEEIEYLFYLSNGSPGIALDLFSLDTLNTFDQFAKICNENKSLSNNIIEFSSEISKRNNDQFLVFLIIIKFILSNILKINLGIDIKKTIGNKLANKLNEISKNLNNYSCFKTLDYLHEYENKLFTFNLDKKIFTINLFSKIVSN